MKLNKIIMKIQLWAILMIIVGVLFILSGLICTQAYGCASIAGPVLFIPFGVFIILVSYKDRFKEASDGL